MQSEWINLVSYCTLESESDMDTVGYKYDVDSLVYKHRANMCRIECCLGYKYLIEYCAETKIAFVAHVKDHSTTYPKYNCISNSTSKFNCQRA